MRTEYIVLILLIAVFGAGALYYSAPANNSQEATNELTDDLRFDLTGQSAIKVTPGVERWYTNTSKTFSFRLPDGFYAPDIETGQVGVYGVRVYNDFGALLTVYAYPVGNGVTLNEETIKGNLPGVHVINIKERVISNFVPGLEFSTDEKEWKGNGLGFWTVYGGYLFEIMTSSENQELFDFIVENWYFAPPSPGRQ